MIEHADKQGRAAPRVRRERWAKISSVIVVLLPALLLALAACQSRDPNTPLSADEGAALLRDVRAGRTGVSDLTPADRVFLHQWLGE